MRRTGEDMYFGCIHCSNNFDFDPLKTCITHNVAYCHAYNILDVFDSFDPNNRQTFALFILVLISWDAYSSVPNGKCVQDTIVK